MRIQHIEKVLNSLGVEPRTVGTKVRSSCPLARWQHTSGSDDHPSFAVWAREDNASPCKCMACGFSGGLTDLIWRVQAKSGADLSWLINFVSGNDHSYFKEVLDKLKYSAGLYSMPADPNEPAIGRIWNSPDAPNFDDAETMVKFAPALPIEAVTAADAMAASLDDEAITYLRKDRNLPDTAVKEWKLGWSSNHRRISIPQYDKSGRLVNIGGRYVPSIMDGSYKPPKWMHAFNFKKELYLFGEDKFDYSRNVSFLVEGMFDAVFLQSNGLPNVGAMCGSYLSRTQADKIVKWFGKLIIIPDGDAPGRDAAARILKQMSKRIPVFVYDTPDGLDPDQLSEYQIEEIKTRFVLDNVEHTQYLL